MKQRPRIYYSASQKALMWERWREGATLHRIAQLFDRSHSSVHRILAETGGIRPPERGRSRTRARRVRRAVLVGMSVEGVQHGLRMRRRTGVERLLRHRR